MTERGKPDHKYFIDPCDHDNIPASEEIVGDDQQSYDQHRK